ncbi:MAG: polymer-forming cytoskeletal protein [Spirochaetia bacterium]|nr:polymer-forming cytoskeletal protein [Spirochaetia bacterium]
MQDSEIDTILGEDISFRGKLVFKKNLKINGRFKGTIVTPGTLVVGQTAQVEADIEAGTISVQGTVKGNILAKTHVELSRNARIHGDIRTPQLQVETGSHFTGSCVMD